MKRYLLFAGYINYPEGGWDDLRGDYEYYSEVENAITGPGCDWEWCHVVDTTIWKVVLNK